MKTLIPFVAVLALIACGCQSTSMLTKMPTMPWKKTADTDITEQKDSESVSAEFGNPQTMLCVWKDGTLDAGNKKVRGLAGRVYFQDAENNPVKVDGTFAVYAYASNGILGPSKIQPERKFVFEQENLNKHYSESELGASYSFWLPWDEVGGDETSISILPIMKTAEGRIVRGEEAAAILPGRRRKTIDSDIQELRQQIEQENKQVLYESNAYDQHVQRQKLMRTDTIRVPRDAEAVLKAMKEEQQRPLERASVIPTTVSAEKSSVQTTEANLTQASTASRLPETSDQAWEQTLNAFRSRGAANNERFDPRNIQRY